MTILQAIQSAYLKAFDFKSRSSRSEFWPGILFHSLMGTIVSIFVNEKFTSALVSSSATQDSTHALIMYWIIFNLLLTIPSLSLQVRRLHDTGRSGWWALIVIIPIIGFDLLWYNCQKGESKANKFGEDPLQIIKGQKVSRTSKTTDKIGENSIIESLTVIAVLIFLVFSIGSANAQSFIEVITKTIIITGLF